MGYLQNARRISATALGLLVAAAAVAQEGFDQNGSDWSVTDFPVIITSDGGTFERAPLSEGQGAPNTSPALPINRGGDKEGRYFEASPATSYSVALVDGWAPPLLDGYVGIGNADSSASQRVGFLMNVFAESTIESLNAYVGLISHTGGSNTATLSIRPIRDGVLGDALATSIPFAVDFGSENYRLGFGFRSVRNPANTIILTAKLHRARVVNDRVVLSRVDLLAEPGVQHIMRVAASAEFPFGGSGVLAFAQGTSSIFFEELSSCGDPCNINGCGCCDASQIEPFLELLFDLRQPGFPCVGDFDGNGRVDTLDIEPFIERLFGP